MNNQYLHFYTALIKKQVHLMKLRNVVILGTGGTIAGRSLVAVDNIGYTAAQVEIGQLVADNPATAAFGPITTEQLCQIDSKDMSFAVWTQLAARVTHFLNQNDVQGIVITHGTDTLEETAYFLQAVCQPAKPVVLTCAMRPATSLASDGGQNILDALAVARYPRACGVVAVCAGTLHNALDVQKVHPYKLDAFSSGDAGPVGYVEEGRLRLLRNWQIPDVKHGFHAMKNIADWPRVEIIMSYAGASAGIVHALVEQGVRGIVVAATGNGSLHHDLEKGLLVAQDAGVRIVRATRCSNGPIQTLSNANFPDSKGLSPAKARVALMLELMATDLLGVVAENAQKAT